MGRHFWLHEIALDPVIIRLLKIEFSVLVKKQMARDVGVVGSHRKSFVTNCLVFFFLRATGARCLSEAVGK